MPRFPSSIASVLLLAAACSPSFDPASRVEKLRILAVRAEPPEIAPAAQGSAPDRAALGALVAHPAFVGDPARRAVVLHIACTPAPGNPAAPSCATISELSAPDALLGAADLTAACNDPGRGTTAALTFAGMEACGLGGCGPVSVRTDPADPTSSVDLPVPAYALPADLDFSKAGAPERVLGTEVIVLALVLDASPEDLAPAAAVPGACAALAEVALQFQALWTEREHVSALKRVRVRGPNADAAYQPNVNPSISALSLGGTALPLASDTLAAIPSIAPGTIADLLPLFQAGDPAALPETYVKCDATGAPIETVTEEWAFSWFATAGELGGLHTRDPAEPELFGAPESGRVLIHAVVRDLRGGIGWTSGVVDVSP